MKIGAAATPWQNKEIVEIIETRQSSEGKNLALQKSANNTGRVMQLNGLPLKYSNVVFKERDQRLRMCTAKKNMQNENVVIYIYTNVPSKELYPAVGYPVLDA